MQRSIATDPDELVRKLFFGSRLKPVNMAALSRKTRINHSTIKNWKRKPSTIPIQKAARIANAQGMSDEDWIKIRRVYK